MEHDYAKASAKRGLGMLTRETTSRWLLWCAILASLGLIALGGAGFGIWLLAVLDGATVVEALLTAMAGFGLWSLLGDLVRISCLASMASAELKLPGRLWELLPGLHRQGLQRDGSRS